MKKKKNTLLSASRIKKWEDCSWLYWCSYMLKLPSRGNSGAARGTACHLVFEMLLAKKRKKYFNKILSKNDVEAIPSIKRLIVRSLKRDGFYSEEDYNLCKKMILVGLNNDFFGKEDGGKVVNAEQKFVIENEDPEYKITGFMDKPISYSKSKTIKIVDYKSSKNKYCDSELDGNIQASTYVLAAKKLWPKMKKYLVEFLFLKFPKEPSQKVEPSKDGTSGFEHYLSHVYKLISNFSKDDAKSNFAIDQPRAKEGFKGPLLCGFAKYPGHLKKNGDPMWHCEYKFAFDYYTLVNENGEVLKTSHEDDLQPAGKEKIIKKHYTGCPAHTQSATKAQENPFDF